MACRLNALDAHRERRSVIPRSSLPRSMAVIVLHEGTTDEDGSPGERSAKRPILEAPGALSHTRSIPMRLSQVAP